MTDSVKGNILSLTLMSAVTFKAFVFQLYTYIPHTPEASFSTAYILAFNILCCCIISGTASLYNQEYNGI